MVDYEDLILERQENQEIWEDDPDSPYLQYPPEEDNWWDNIPDDEFEEVRR